MVEIVNTKISKNVSLEVREVLGSHGMTMRFLEHVFDFKAWKSTSEIIATTASNKKFIFVSKDNGDTWEKVWPKKQDLEANKILELEESEEKCIIGRCFTTSTGRRLLQLSKNNNPGNVYIFSNNWEYIGKRSTGKFNWHGSFSIGEQNKIILFSEYAVGADKLYVWRTQDDGNTWEKVFEQTSHLIDTYLGDIRHFHTCFPWPNAPGNSNAKNGAWLVSSGDTDEQSKVWISYDCGDSWKNITDKSFPLNGDDFTRSVHRYTTLQYLEDGSILWATDDHACPERSASLVKAEIENDVLKLNILTSLSSNNIRSLIDFGSYFLSISEAKEPDITKAYVQVLRKEEPYIELSGTIDAPRRNGFTYSRSSIMAYKNVAFSYNMLRWELKERDDITPVQQSQNAGNPPFICSICNAVFSECYDEERCPECKNPARIRALPEIIQKHIPKYTEQEIIDSYPMLGFCVEPDEYVYLKKVFDDIQAVPLYVVYMNRKSGVDTSEFLKFKNDSFSCVFSILLYDYLEEYEKALKEAYRVLAPGGVFVTLIAYYMLSQDDKGTTKKYIFKGGGGYSHYLSEEMELPSIPTVTKGFTKLMNKVGFQEKVVNIFDEASGAISTFFIGKKDKR